MYLNKLSEIAGTNRYLELADQGSSSPSNISPFTIPIGIIYLLMINDEWYICGI